ncbi:EamA family transporter [Frigidibacter sp. RF13]|uniref:EamA family transporter n=1 Tax=Frigidibacter sp. RF13 TaxID=2997340 RepID=UPI00226DA86B|nr:EamA family transporter [Frigidibacter sp. RF13]MCY1126966.1 EamA family transporter [Frigidibacter sp. RF13]
MSLFILSAVLGAAFLHALWNGLVRGGASRVHVMMVLSAVQGGIGLVLGFFSPFPGAEVWPWLAASALVHTAYKTFLTFAYEHGDLSRVYPLARGTAPLIVLVVGAAFGTDHLAVSEALGIAVLGAGIFLLATGVFTSGESVRLLPYAMGAALATASYTLIDGQGARIGGNAAAYVAWMFAADGVLFALVMSVLRGRGAWPARAGVWGAGSVAAVASYASYAIVVWAMTEAPIALVAAIRETSIVFGVVIGWLVFRERMTWVKGASALMIAAGVAITRL